MAIRPNDGREWASASEGGVDGDRVGEGVGGSTMPKLRENDPSGQGGEHRSSVLTAYDKFLAMVHTVVPPGGILSGAFNIASCAVGAGILGLPGGTNRSGVVISLILFAVMTFFAVFSIYIMAIAVHKTNIESFEIMARALFPRGHYAFSYWAAFIRFFNGISASIAYVICIGNLFTPIFEEAHKRSPDNRAIEFLNTTKGNRLLTTLLWLCVMMPLLIPKHIDSLRYASTFAVTFLVYFSIVVFVHGCMHGLNDLKGRVKVDDRGGDAGSTEKVVYLFRTGNVLLSSMGVYMFAYTCQLAVYEIWWDMRPEIRTPRNFGWSALIGVLMTTFIYAVTGIFGYLDFGSTIGSNSILLMYNPIKEPAIMIAYVGIMFKLCVSYALLGTTARNSIYYIIGWQRRYAGKPALVQKHHQDSVLTGSQKLQSVDEDTKHIPVGELTPISSDNDTTYIDNIPFLRHLLVVLILCVVSLICGLFIPSLHTVFGFGGAINGGFLSFIFPALFYMYSGGFTVKREGWFNYLTTYVLLICGVIGVVFGLAGTIYDAV